MKSDGFAFPGDVSLTLNMTRIKCHSERSEESPGRVRSKYYGKIKSDGFAFPGDPSAEPQDDRLSVVLSVSETSPGRVVYRKVK